MRDDMNTESKEKGGDSALDFETLDVYQLALRFVHKLIRLVRTFPGELQPSLGSYALTKAMSMLTSIVEASGGKSSKERRECFETGLQSARQCIPMITIAHREGFMTDQQKDELRNDCLGICTKLLELADSSK